MNSSKTKVVMENNTPIYIYIYIYIYIFHSDRDDGDGEAGTNFTALIFTYTSYFIISANE